MKNLRTRLLLIICTGLMGLLAACGDSAATPTVVAPTATTATAAATATTAAMPAATATTAAMPAATATTAAMPAATATTAVMAAATATTGGSTTGLPAALQSAAQAMQGLTSYHFSATTDMGATGSTSVEGDVVLPDKMAMTSTANMAGQTVETKIVTIGSTVWTNAGGQWIKTEGMPTPMNPTTMTSGLTDVTNAEDLGETTLDGLAVQHLRYTSADMGAGAATSEVWIDKATSYVAQVKTESDTPAGKVTTTVKFSRFNDPAIVIEEPQ